MDIESGKEEHRPLDASLFDPPLPEKYTCVICTNVVYRPLNLSCAHLFCQPCIKQSWQSQGSFERDAFKCPKCRSLTPHLNPDDPQKIILSINHIINGDYKVKCPNTDNGCTIVLECLGTDRRTLIDHLNKCDYEEIKCDQCNQKMQRMALINHQSNDCMERMVECEYCKKQMTEKNRIDHLDHSEANDEKKSSEALVASSSSSSVSITGCKNRSYCSNKENGCEWMGLTELLSDHVKQCCKGIIDCPVCGEEILREVLSSHNNDAAEMHSMFQRLEKRFGAKFETKIQQLEKELADQKKENDKMKAVIQQFNNRTNDVSCILAYALPIASIQPGASFEGKSVFQSKITRNYSLQVKLRIEIDEKENVGLLVRNESSQEIFFNWCNLKLLQWKNNKLVTVKHWTGEDQSIAAFRINGHYGFVPTANWKNPSPENDWTSPLPPPNSMERQLFDIHDSGSNGNCLLLMVKANIRSSVNINGKNEADGSFIKMVNGLQP